MQTTAQTKTSKPAIGPQGRLFKPTNQNFAHGKGRSHLHKPDRDPILEIVCHAIEEAKRADPSHTNKFLAAKAGISPQTISR